MEYWNKYTETLPREKLDNTEFKYFKNLFAYRKSHSEALRRKAERDRAGRHQDLRGYQEGALHVQGRAAEMAGERRALPLWRASRHTHRGGLVLQADERHDGQAGLCPRVIRELAVEDRIMVPHSLDGGFQAEAQAFPPLRLQRLRRILGGPLRCRKGRLRGGAGRRSRHKGQGQQDHRAEGQCHGRHAHLHAQHRAGGDGNGHRPEILRHGAHTRRRASRFPRRRARGSRRHTAARCSTTSAARRPAVLQACARRRKGCTSWSPSSSWRCSTARRCRKRWRSASRASSSSPPLGRRSFPVHTFQHERRSDQGAGQV